MRAVHRYLTALSLALALISSAFLLALEWIGERTGATVLPRQMAAEQAADVNLVALPAEIRHWAALKVPRIAFEQPDIVLIGSSRGNEVRSAMFRPYKFYNASLTCWSLEQMRAMLDQVTKVAKPRVIILSLDYFMFTDVYAASVTKERTMLFDDDLKIEYQSAINLLRSIYKYPYMWRDQFPEYLKGSPPARPDGVRMIGLDAIRADAGFRWDGSFRYEAGLLASAPQRTRDNKGLIEAMPGGPKMEPHQLTALERIAALGRDRQVSLVAVQWPILKASTDYLDNEPSYRPYAGVWKEFESPETARKLRDLGIAFFDLSRLPMTADNRNFIDAAHADEAGMLDALIHLNEEPDFHAMVPEIDINALREQRAAALEQGRFIDVYGNNF
jgi:hypothetical protein